MLCLQQSAAQRCSVENHVHVYIGTYGSMICFALLLTCASQKQNKTRKKLLVRHFPQE